MWETLESRRMMSVTLVADSTLPYVEADTTVVSEKTMGPSNYQKKNVTTYNRAFQASNVLKTLDQTAESVISKIG